MKTNPISTFNLRHSFSRGFTLVEIVAVVAILSILISIAMPSFSDFRNSKTLDTTSEEILAVLSTARGNTLSAKNGAQYGVHFEESKFVLYTGATYSSIDSNNKNYILENVVEISSFTYENVLFDKLTGNTAQDGTVVVSVKANPTMMRTIIVSKNGIVSLQ